MILNCMENRLEQNTLESLESFLESKYSFQLNDEKTRFALANDVKEWYMRNTVDLNRYYRDTEYKKSIDMFLNREKLKYYSIMVSQIGCDSETQRAMIRNFFSKL